MRAERQPVSRQWADWNVERGEFFLHRWRMDGTVWREICWHVGETKGHRVQFWSFETLRIRFGDRSCVPIESIQISIQFLTILILLPIFLATFNSDKWQNSTNLNILKSNKGNLSHIIGPFRIIFPLVVQVFWVVSVPCNRHVRQFSLFMIRTLGHYLHTAQQCGN